MTITVEELEQKRTAYHQASNRYLRLLQDYESGHALIESAKQRVEALGAEFNQAWLDYQQQALDAKAR